VADQTPPTLKLIANILTTADALLLNCCISTLESRRVFDRAFDRRTFRTNKTKTVKIHKPLRGEMNVERMVW
jgi:hypothetical protein